MGSAFDHNPSITVPGAGNSTNTGIVTWSGTGGNTFLDSTVLVVGNNITIPGTITFGGVAITSTAAELNKLAGASSDVTAANLNALTGSGATALHSHSGGALTPWTSDIDTDGYDLITNDNNEDINIIPHGTGKVGIGTNSPSYRLDVQGQAKVEHSGQDYMAFLRNTDSSAPYGLHIYFTNGSYGGTTHPFLVCKNEGQSGNDMAKILSDGDFLSRSDSYGGMSDERVKQDIIEATPALPELIKMKVKEYKFVWTPEKTERGIIAQEFIADGINIPSFISILEDTHINNQGQEETVDTYTASYNKLIPWLVQAVQELNAKIDALS